MADAQPPQPRSRSPSLVQTKKRKSRCGTKGNVQQEGSAKKNFDGGCQRKGLLKEAEASAYSGEGSAPRTPPAAEAGQNDDNAAGAAPEGEKKAT
ncbi:hypothetical protein N7471_012735 [Penicillium samsonianum]|uniref:uncharacterized protein n=1 Tax=Penicillium samsonianum TaxID=1882272 RepID=UPI002548DFD2|nr:uncharacterized protein N7471_012735 [Penicillium samsonianum]KAJ6125418.1 hypothetical protein N7471_012735 [Penicillium samsonianum]